MMPGCRAFWSATAGFLLALHGAGASAEVVRVTFVARVAANLCPGTETTEAQSLSSSLAPTGSDVNGDFYYDSAAPSVRSSETGFAFYTFDPKAFGLKLSVGPSNGFVQGYSAGAGITPALADGSSGEGRLVFSALFDGRAAGWPGPVRYVNFSLVVRTRDPRMRMTVLPRALSLEDLQSSGLPATLKLEGVGYMHPTGLAWAVCGYVTSLKLSTAKDEISER
jgi:hypothetical protein